MRARAAAFLLLPAAMALQACGDSDSDLEKSLRKNITAQSTADVQFVECPNAQNVKTGQTFHCKALIPVDVTQVDDNGNLRWQITNLSGKPGATGVTGPTLGTTGPTLPLGATGTTGPTFPLGATGTAPGAGSFKTFRNRSQGYAIDHPPSFTRRGSGRDVTLSGAGGAFVKIQVGRSGRLRASKLRRELSTNKQISDFGAVTPQTVGGESGFFVRLTFRRPPLKVQRYIVERRGRRISVDISAPPKTADDPQFQSQAMRIANSFRLL